jgi:gliding motility-associated-like protein
LYKTHLYLTKKYIFETAACSANPMQLKPTLLFLIILLFAGTGLLAQENVGSLGEPVFTFDFGSGNTPMFPPATGYQYVAGSCPNDGQYAISKTETGCHDDTWHSVLKDHTGNDGYMMVVNADEVEGKKFFEYALNDGTLCENTTYEFSAYILNLMKAGQSGVNKPNVSFIIEKPNGEPIGVAEQVEIPETTDPNGWVKYYRRFTTTAGITSVIIKMVNNAPGGSGNDLLLDDIAFRAFGPDVKAGVADAVGNISTEPTNQCVGTSKTYHIKSQLTNYPTYKYQWQQNLNDGAGWTDILSETSPALDLDFPANKPIGTYQYHLGVAVGDNINSPNCRVYSNPVTISISSYPISPAPSSITICEGDLLPLTASGGATYKWTLPDMSVISQGSFTIPNATKANEGRYNLEIISAANCSAFSYVDVTVNLKPVVIIDQVIPVCRGNSTQLTTSVTTPGAYSYNWLPAVGLSDAHVANPIAGPNNSTLYTVTVTDNTTGCTGTANIQVNVLDLPVAHAGNDKKIFEGQSIKLDGSATGNVTYSWSPQDYLDDPHSPAPIASPPYDVNYLLTVTSANGCGTNTDDVFVRVYQKIVVPSTFTPNNDGVNDIWNIEALETYPQSTISVYTRNGKQVFQSQGYGKPWDGKFNGALLRAGTYYYVIDLKNGTPNMSGWVLLVR